MAEPRTGRRGIVTGAASGIGRAIAGRLLREGVETLAVDINTGRLQDLAAAGCATLIADLADSAGRDRLADEQGLEAVSAMHGTASAELNVARVRNVPLGRGAAPEECASLIWFLLSDESVYTAGQAINFTSGMVNEETTR